MDNNLTEKEVLTSIGSSLIQSYVRKAFIESLLVDAIEELSDQEIENFCKGELFRGSYQVLKTIEGMINAIISSTDEEYFKSGKVLYLEAKAAPDNFPVPDIEQEDAREALSYIHLKKLRLRRLQSRFSKYREKQAQSSQKTRLQQLAAKKEIN